MPNLTHQRGSPIKGLKKFPIEWSETTFYGPEGSNNLLCMSSISTDKKADGHGGIQKAPLMLLPVRHGQ